MKRLLAVLWIPALLLGVRATDPEDGSPDRCDVALSSHDARKSLEEFNRSVDRAWHTYRSSVNDARDRCFKDLNEVFNQLLKKRDPDLVEVTTLLAAMYRISPEASSNKRLLQHVAVKGNVPAGNWIELAPLIEPTVHAVAGEWKRTGVGVTGTGRLKVPVNIESGDYKLRVEFTRDTGLRTPAFVLPVHGFQCTVALATDDGACDRIHLVNGRELRHPPTAITNGQRHLIEFVVRKDRKDSRIDVIVDSERVWHWQGNAEDLKMHGDWTIHSPHQLGIVSRRSQTTFHSIELYVPKAGGARFAFE